MEALGYSGTRSVFRNPNYRGSSLIARTLLSIASSVDSKRLDTLAFRTMDGGYQSADLDAVGRFTVTALRSPICSIMSLRGYSDGPSLFRVVHGALTEYRFDPVFRGYRFRRLRRDAKTPAQPLFRGFHLLEAAELSLSIHVQAASDDLATSAVPESVLPYLRDAFNWHIDETWGRVPPRLFAMLSGAP